MTDTKPLDASPALSPHDAWLAKRREPILEPDLPIVDPQHHLWTHEPRFMFEELLRETGSGHNVVGSVFVECHSMYRADGPDELKPVGETEFVNGVAAMSASGEFGAARLCAGIVGYADINLGAAVKPVLDAHIRAGNGRFSGVRFSTAWHPVEATLNLLTPPLRGTKGQMQSPGFRAGFACMGPLGLVYDAVLYHHQLIELAELARAFPDTRIVVNHLGVLVGIGEHAPHREDIFDDWRRDMAELARCPNVYMKVGGLANRSRGFGFGAWEIPPSSQDLATAWKPWVETAIEAFGVEHCMLESNFPVDRASCSYATLWNAFKTLTAGCTEAEKAALYAGTATKVYNLALAG